jgi:hypothetical protein
MDFPRYVFKSPGAVRIPEGSYDLELVVDQEGYDKHVKAGWNETILGAVEAGKTQKAEKAPKAP